jgi:hypothetical protein
MCVGRQVAHVHEAMCYRHVATYGQTGFLDADKKGESLRSLEDKIWCPILSCRSCSALTKRHAVMRHCFMLILLGLDEGHASVTAGITKRTLLRQM